MIRWQAIVFDLDDTLYPERQYVHSGLQAVADWAQQALGFPSRQTYAELVRLFDGGSRTEAFDRWLLGHGLERAVWVPAMVAAYRRHEPRIAPFDDVVPLLERLRGHCLLGLVTDGNFEVQRRKLAALSLESFFQAIVYSDLLGREHWKPSPRPFREVAQLLSVPAAQAVYVADNPAKDFRGARRAGMAAIRVRRPDGLYCHLEPSSYQDAPDAEIAELGELARIVRL